MTRERPRPDRLFGARLREHRPSTCATRHVPPAVSDAPFDSATTSNMQQLVKVGRQQPRRRYGKRREQFPP